MEPTGVVVVALLGAALGAALVYVLMVRPAEKDRAGLQADHAVATERATKADSLEAQLAARDQALSDLRERLAAADTAYRKEQESAAEKRKLLEEAEKRLSDAFKALSGDALRANNDAFLQLAQQKLGGLQTEAKADLENRQQAITALLTPMRQSLEKVDTKLQALEKDRAATHASISQQVRSLIEVQKELRGETANLAKALRSPTARGQWGQIQLRRVVEMAGMVAYCDFEEEVATEGGRQRPDLVVRLPGGKNIVVDAKAVMAAYFEAIQTDDDGLRSKLLGDHARQVRDRIKDLGGKTYWQQFDPAPEFVVLFLPGEMLFSAALERDPGLIEAGVDKGVLLATPTTLIGLLRAVAYGWRQEQMAENAREISDLGQELHKRLSDLGGHFSRLGKALDQAVGAFNGAVGTLESRVLVSARRFEQLGAGRAGVAIEAPKQVNKQTRRTQAPELIDQREDPPVPALDADDDGA